MRTEIADLNGQQTTVSSSQSSAQKAAQEELERLRAQLEETRSEEETVLAALTAEKERVLTELMKEKERVQKAFEEDSARLGADHDQIQKQFSMFGLEGTRLVF